MGREPLTRAEFLKLMAAGAGGVVFLGGSEDALAALAGAEDDLDRAALDGDLRAAADLPDMTVVKGRPIGTNVKTAIAKLGGMKKFVSSGDVVVIKPNICTARAPKYAATTNPTVVATIARLALAAGAAKVRVMDNPISVSAASAYKTSGIKKAVDDIPGTKAAMQIMSASRFKAYDLGSPLNAFKLYRDAVDCDVLINVPIAKQHGSTGLTLAGKNMMGIPSDRGKMHTEGLSKTITLVNKKLKPELTVIDAIRILIAHGPTGGSLSDVRRKDTIIASADWVAADAYATRLFGKTPSFVPYIKAAHDAGLGENDLSKLTIKKYTV